MLRTIKHQNSKKFLPLRGSALIIALLTITVISTIGFTVGRLMVSELRQSNQIEDSMMAYYAAESGIEQGLLMWWYNQDVEVPEVKGGMSEGDTQTLRVNLSNMDTDEGDIDSPPEGDKKSPYYDLRIWYKNNIVDGQSKEIVCSQQAIDDESGDCTANPPEGQTIINTGDKPAIAKDDYVQYDVTGLKKIYINWEFENPCIDDQKRKCKLEFISIDENNNEIKKTFDYEDRNRNKDRDVEESKISRIRIYGGRLKEYSISAPESSNDGEKMSSKYTIIESTGYFGSAKRRLQIKIDRYSKTIFGPYDMVIYQGE